MRKFVAFKRVFHYLGSDATTRHNSDNDTHSTSNSLLHLKPPKPAEALAEPMKAEPPSKRNHNKFRSRRLYDCPTPTITPLQQNLPTLPKPDYFPDKPTLDQFSLIKTIGTGSFGRVFLAKMPDRPKVPPLAIKQLKKSAVLRQKHIEHVLSERDILGRMNHPLIVRMYTTFQDLKYLYIVMEYVAGGEFFTYLRRSKRLDNGPSKFFAAHVTLIFEYLHSMEIVYRDLKPENLLISPDGYLKLTDFGFAKFVRSRTYTLCGTPEYIAPEVLLNKGHGKAVDWWALGILIYEMMVGYPPFFDEDALGIYRKILHGRVIFPAYFDRDAKSLVKHLLTHDVIRRYGHIREGVSDVRRHRWFADFDFAALLAGEMEPPYKPRKVAEDDTSHFGTYEEPPADDEVVSVEGSGSTLKSEDPFVDW